AMFNSADHDMKVHLKNGSDSLCILRRRRCVHHQTKSSVRVHQKVGQRGQHVVRMSDLRSVRLL
ncbi:hypothetical protein A2U01_0057605, partial [Trifolium medium]|nr:hypothetical protein [Trifolium medium]